jgi:hypothetical protein
LPAILSTSRHGRSLPPACDSEVPHHIEAMRNGQLINYYDGNDRLMPNGDPTVFGFPCRFLRVPVDRDHGFHLKAISQSSVRRSWVPLEGDHPIR